jgi:hypothetical protein
MRKVFSGSIPRVFSSLASVIVLWLLIFSSPSALAQGTATVSPDLVSLYRTTEGKLDAASLDKIVAQCSDVLAEAQRTKADRRYAQQLLAWAANQRGQMASDEAGRLVEEGSRRLSPGASARSPDAEGTSQPSRRIGVASKVRRGDSAVF